MRGGGRKGKGEDRRGEERRWVRRAGESGGKQGKRTSHDALSDVLIVPVAGMHAMY